MKEQNLWDPHWLASVLTERQKISTVLQKMRSEAKQAGKGLISDAEDLLQVVKVESASDENVSRVSDLALQEVFASIAEEN